MKMNFLSCLKIILLIFVSITLFSQHNLFAAQQWGGVLTLNYRAIGQKPKEVEVENQMLISDFYLNLTDDRIKDLPFFLEFAADLEGRLQLYRVTLHYIRWKEINFTIGRFLIPFGLYNKLYRPDLYFTLTKPLLYATPGLDYVSGVNFPHPVFASGYVDTGFNVDIHGKYLIDTIFMPSHISLFLVNGFQEQGREPLRPLSFIIFSPAEGVDLDWGHERNFLADNNDTKSIGGRVVYDFGDLSLLIPTYPVGKKLYLNGFSFGMSGMGGKYDIEDRLTYVMYGADVAFQCGEFSISAEYGYSANDFKSRDYELYLTTPTPTVSLLKDRYYTHGAYVQVVFPFPEFPLSKKTNLIFRTGRITRWGPELVVPLDPEASVGYIIKDAGKIRTRINKYTVAFNSWMSDHFTLKLEFSYWDFNRYEDIYQLGIGGVLSF